MALKTFNPTSAGRRHLVQVDKSHLFKGKPVKSLVEGANSHGGRSGGRITSRRKGGGHKTAYRLIDFKRIKHDMPAVVEHLEYDPNRTAFIALIKYQDGTLSYILAPQRLAPGDTVISGKLVDVKPGNAMEIGSIPVGTVVHNVETKPGAGGSLARAAGTYAMVAGRDGANVIIRLKSGETRLVPA
ncbi:MAG TPA: 50S ribosomal protein L2, partial [Aestuariivirga sp.]